MTLIEQLIAKAREARADYMRAARAATDPKVRSFWVSMAGNANFRLVGFHRVTGGQYKRRRITA